MPLEADALLSLIHQANIHNFDGMLEDPFLFPLDPTFQSLKPTQNKPTIKPTCCYSTALAENLKTHLVQQFKIFYTEILGPKPEFKAEVFFGPDEAQELVKSFNQICNGDLINTSLMDHLIGGQIEFLAQSIPNWMDAEFFQLQLIKEAEHNAFYLLECRRIQEAAAAMRKRNKAEAMAKRLEKRQAREVEVNAEKALCANNLAADKAWVAMEKAAKKSSLQAKKAAEKERLDWEKTEKVRVAKEKAVQLAQEKEEKDRLKVLAAKARKREASLKQSKRKERIKANDDARVLAAEDKAKQKRSRAKSIESKKLAAQVKRVDRKRHQMEKMARNTSTIAQIQEYQAQKHNCMEDAIHTDNDFNGRQIVIVPSAFHRYLLICV